MLIGDKTKVLQFFMLFTDSFAFFYAIFSHQKFYKNCILV